MGFPKVFIRKDYGRFFMYSHIFGWAIATAQTIWIVWRLEKINRKVIQEIRNKK